MTSARFATWAAPIWWLAPALAWAEPLDLADPTPRTIQVEFEISVSPLAIGQTYSAPVVAQYSATGNIGTVVVPRALYELAIQTQNLDYFAYMMTWSLIGGSASDFTLDIDLTTHQATAHTLDYDVSITVPVVQDGTVTRELSTTATAGFGVQPQFPNFPFFTTTPCGTCALVPGAPYNPLTGKLNAVGRDSLVAPDITLSSFSRAGDLRLSESPTATVPALSSPALGSLVAVLASFAFLMIRRGQQSPRTAA